MVRKSTTNTKQKLVVVKGVEEVKKTLEKFDAELKAEMNIVDFVVKMKEVMQFLVSLHIAQIDREENNKAKLKEVMEKHKDNLEKNGVIGTNQKKVRRSQKVTS